jgi:hypothetical protein
MKGGERRERGSDAAVRMAQKRGLLHGEVLSIVRDSEKVSGVSARCGGA